MPISTDNRPSIYDLDRFEAFLGERGFRERDLRRVRRLLFREGATLDSIAWGDAGDLSDQFATSHLRLVSRQDSSVDGASKLLFETADGRQLETVILRIASGRTSLCVSSQTGCTEKCRFCATGAIQFYRNLDWTEIIDQVVQASHLIAPEGRQIRNIVFMGMGEALRNGKNLRRAIDLLTTGRAFQFAPGKLCVSSLGLPEHMLEFAREYPEVNLALSLNAPNDSIRSVIMPINEKYPMARLLDMLIQLEAMRPNREIMVGYVLFRDLNDAPEHARQLSRFLEGRSVHLNLIPFNPDEGTPADLLPSTLERTKAFQAILQDAGFKVTRRYSLGQDVAAACGQLANQRAVGSG
jgi:23S rRNA (adenine2503-C2)-methyltransferase